MVNSSLHCIRQSRMNPKSENVSSGGLRKWDKLSIGAKPFRLWPPSAQFTPVANDTLIIQSSHVVWIRLRPLQFVHRRPSAAIRLWINNVTRIVPQADFFFFVPFPSLLFMDQFSLQRNSIEPQDCAWPRLTPSYYSFPCYLYLEWDPSAALSHQEINYFLPQGGVSRCLLPFFFFLLYY